MHMERRNATDFLEKENTMNDSLLERYRRDPITVRLEIEAAARRERALFLAQLLKRAMKALFGTGRSRAAGRPLSGTVFR